jgi:hypothetical protein
MMAPDNLPFLIVSLILTGAGQGMVISLALNTILSGLTEAQDGMGSGRSAPCKWSGPRSEWPSLALCSFP